MSQPLTPSALPSITPSIQPGQAMVAKPSFWKDAVQSSLHCTSLVDSPSSASEVTVSKTCLTSGLSAAMTLLSASSKEYSVWLIIAWAVAPEASYHATSGTALTKSRPASK